MKIITGPFHPDLELALTHHIRQLKAHDPLAPIAVVVPSSLLVRRVRELLVLEEGLSLLNVHILTFHQLARRLYEDWPAAGAKGDALAYVDLVSSFFFEELLGRIITTAGLPDLERLRAVARPTGGRATLWTTIRDLREAQVDPHLALQALSEGVFDAEDQAMMQAVLTLHGAVYEACRALRVGSQDDMAGSVALCVPASRWLAGLAQVCYYGFYDLTQVQLSLLDAVAKATPVTLFFPLAHGAGFDFARRFFERAVLPRAAVPPQSAEKRPESAALACRIMNAVGPDDELALVCKEILALVEVHGYRWADIGVIARTLDPYQASLQRVFEQHRIPLTTTATTWLLQRPEAKSVLQLATLPLTQFYRVPVLDVLTSPFYRIDASLAGLDVPRPDLWRVAVQALGITRGEAEWQRLATLSEVEAVTGRGEEGSWDVGAVTIPADQVRLLWRLVSALLDEYRTLPVSGRVAALTDAFLGLVARHFEVPGLTAAPPEAGCAREAGDGVGTALQAVLDELRQLDRMAGEVTWEEWAGLFARALERAVIPMTGDDRPGVQVLDAMSARGLPFRAVFAIGLNEKVFPRFIHEDAFLRDRERRALETTLGYKIDEKLGGYEEEALLFTLVRQAARHRLYLLYQRADAEGRPLAGSPYLGEFLPPMAERDEGAEIGLPRRFSDRLGLPHYAPSWLTRDDLALSLVLQGADPEAVLRGAGREAALFRNGCLALEQLERERADWGPFDGNTAALDAHWAALTTRGLAPTSLEQYAQCPFRYFGAQVLRLESNREPMSRELPPLEVGGLCHAVLRATSERLLAGGWPTRTVTDDAVQAEVQRAVERVCTDYARVHGTGYALVWDLLRETLSHLAVAALREDQNECRASGFVPIGFEVTATGMLEGLGTKELDGLPIRGRFDRLDRRVSPPAVRVVDFKYRVSTKMQDKERQLLLSAVRGFRLQPPLYVLLQASSQPGGPPARPERVEFVYLAPSWKPVVQRARFDAAEWAGPNRSQLRATLTCLLAGVKEGQFPILPDRYCDYCEFRTACRLSHGPTWWRAHQSALARRLRRMRKQKMREA